MSHRVPSEAAGRNSRQPGCAGTLGKLALQEEQSLPVPETGLAKSKGFYNSEDGPC